MNGRERFYDASEVCGGARVADVEIEGRSYVTMNEHRDSADQHELDLRLDEPSYERREVRHGFFIPARSASAVRMSSSIASMRSVGVIASARRSCSSSMLEGMLSSTRYCQGSSTGRHMPRV